jgi:hypothetical protein
MPPHICILRRAERDKKDQQENKDGDKFSHVLERGNVFHAGNYTHALKEISPAVKTGLIVKSYSPR